jgi:hypothetical protein
MVAILIQEIRLRQAAIADYKTTTRIAESIDN